MSAIGVIFLLLMYAGILSPAKGLMIFGALNDFCVLVQYALALPLIFAFHRHPARVSPRLRLVALICGLIGALGAIGFQALLLADLMAFREQVLYAASSVLLVGVWILITGLVIRRSDPGGMSVGLSTLGALYFGYPFWVYRAARYLEQRRRADAG